MKKLLLFCCTILSFLSVHAQVSNPGFETINTQSNGPDKWGPGDYFILPVDTNCSWTGLDSISFWSTDAHSGVRSYEIRIATYCTTGYSGNLKSGMYLVDTFAEQRVPFAGRPDSFTFYYKFNSVGGDFMNAAVRLELADGYTLGYGGVTVEQSASGWTMATMPMQYADTMQPDYYIMFFTIQNDTNTNFGTRFVVDDINAVFPTSVADVEKNDRILQCFPNPAKDVLNVSVPKPTEQSGRLVVMDAVGRTVIRKEIDLSSANSRVDVSNLPAGIYSLKISTATDIFTGRFIK